MSEVEQIGFTCIGEIDELWCRKLEVWIESFVVRHHRRQFFFLSQDGMGSVIAFLLVFFGIGCAILERDVGKRDLYAHTTS